MEFNPIDSSATDVNLTFHQKLDRLYGEEPNSFIPEVLDRLNRKSPLIYDVMNVSSEIGLSEGAIHSEHFEIHPFSVADILNVLAVDDLLPGPVNEK